MNDQDRTLIEETIHEWGPELQLAIIVEEMSELTKECCKLLRIMGTSSSISGIPKMVIQSRMEGVVDEMADVEISLMILEVISDQLLGEDRIAGAVKERKRFKMERLEQRLKIYRLNNKYRDQIKKQ